LCSNLTDFVIDTVAPALTGPGRRGQFSARRGAAVQPDVRQQPRSPFDLALEGAAAGALTALFGLPDLTGFTIGTANTLPISAVPEPATCAALLMGLAMISRVFARRGKQRQQASVTA